MIVLSLPDVSGLVTNAQNNIRTVRLEKNMSPAELARLAGCTAPQVSNIEAGRTPGSVILLLRLATVLDVPLSELFEERPESA